MDRAGARGGEAVEGGDQGHEGKGEQEGSEGATLLEAFQYPGEEVVVVVWGGKGVWRVGRDFERRE